MAEKDKKKDEAPETKEPKKKSPMKLILIVVIALIAVGGGATAFIMMKGGGGDEDSEATPEAEIAEIGEIVHLEEFTVNLSDNAGQHYLRVKIDLEVDAPELVNLIEQRTPLIRDTILLLLSGLTLEDINTVEGKDALKASILSRVEQHLRAGAIRRVLFVEFLVQAG